MSRLGCHTFMTLLYRLLFPITMFLLLLQWIFQKREINTQVTSHAGSISKLVALPDFSMTNQVLLSDVILLNHWHIALLEGLHNYVYGTLLMLLEVRTDFILYIFLASLKIFFTMAERKPPDPITTKAVMPSDSISIDEDLDTPTSSPTTSPSKPTICVDVNNLNACNERREGESISDASSKPYHYIWTSNKNMYKSRTVQSFLVTTMSSNSKPNNTGLNLDQDSYNFAVDLGSSDHVCSEKSLFIDDIKPLRNVNLQGIGGTIPAIGFGTIRFTVYDDEALEHVFTIHNVLYVPQAPMNLLSPQKWVAGRSNEEREARGACSLTFDDITILMWERRQYMKTIHHRADGIPIMTVNEGFESSKVFLSELQPICLPCLPSYLHTSKRKSNKTVKFADDPNQQIILNDDNDVSNDDEDHERIDSDDLFIQDDQEVEVSVEEPEQESESLQLPVSQLDAILKTLHEPRSQDENELRLIHEKLKHLPESRLHRLAEKGIIPHKFKHVKLPPCASCIFGKQHKRPWRTRAKQRHSIRREDQKGPGANTSTDQLESSHAGLIPQVKGILMNARYIGATVFVDHATDFCYIHLMKDLSGESTLEAKNAYERRAESHGVKILNYHADNGRFAENMFIADTEDKRQGITFCGVGAHHQNGIAEKFIRDSQESARTSLVHANQLWPEAVKLSLWPFALKAYERSRNLYNLDENGLSPIEKFSRLQNFPEVKHEHPLFCPVFVLDSNLQGDIKGVPKWEPRSRAGVYLGQSPTHAGSVAMVLNLKTGHVSCQFHVVFDDTFSTVEYLRKKEEPPFWSNLVETSTEFYGQVDPDDEEGLKRSDRLDLLGEIQSIFDLDESQRLARQEGELGTSEGAEVGALEGDDSSVSSSAERSNADAEASEGEASPTEPSPTELDLEYFNTDTAGLRRSKRKRSSVKRFSFLLMSMLPVASIALSSTAHAYSSLRKTLKYKPMTSQESSIFQEEMVQLNEDSTYKLSTPPFFCGPEWSK